jgi:hypothetical protein
MVCLGSFAEFERGGRWEGREDRRSRKSGLGLGARLVDVQVSCELSLGASFKPDLQFTMIVLVNGYGTLVTAEVPVTVLSLASAPPGIVSVVRLPRVSDSTRGRAVSSRFRVAVGGKHVELHPCSAPLNPTYPRLGIQIPEHPGLGYLQSVSQPRFKNPERRFHNITLYSAPMLRQREAHSIPGSVIVTSP